MASSSSLSPLLESAITTSAGATMPRSPCMASRRMQETAGQPVEVSVAAIFRAAIPDFPTPVVITFPRRTVQQPQRESNRSSSRPAARRMASASTLSVSTANSIQFIAVNPSMCEQAGSPVLQSVLKRLVEGYARLPVRGRPEAKRIAGGAGDVGGAHPVGVDLISVGTRQRPRSRSSTSPISTGAPVATL